MVNRDRFKVQRSNRIAGATSQFAIAASFGPAFD